MKNKGIRQYGIVCRDDDNNDFKAFTKAKDKPHARAIIQDRIRRKCSTEIKRAMGNGYTVYKAIVGRAKDVGWTSPSL